MEDAIEITRRDFLSLIEPAIEFLADTALTDTRSSLSAARVFAAPPNLGDRNYLAEEAVEMRSNLLSRRAVLGENTVSGMYAAL